ncbi:hypothetical protein MTR67_030160 [Solanum verrucosum]|uniref:Uncharacterized protein n=1 Tax=Solanum verrucosum TaxID=315347 RepID=A0AAF0U0L5_SOLVR|nr:hypothetical protein MTR67_030160 [Solanum verrucosum]
MVSECRYHPGCRLGV